MKSANASPPYGKAVRPREEADPAARRLAWRGIARFGGLHLVAAAVLGVGCHLLASTLAGWAAERLQAEATAAAAAAPPGAPPGGAGGQPMPGLGQGAQASFQLPMLGGGQLALADFKGQVVVLDFWASWCGPCRQQATILDEMYADLGRDPGVKFLAINVGEAAGLVETYQERSPFPYPVLLDTTQQVAGRFGAQGLPTLVVIDGQGRIAFKHIGVLPASRLRAAIDDARTRA